VQYGTPVVLLALIGVNIYQAVVISQLQRDIRDLRSSITWGAQCNERHARIDERLDRIEKKVFNGGS
jgi:hypothetical protein